MSRLIISSLALSLILSPLSAFAGASLYGNFRYSVGSVTDGTGYDGTLVASDNTSLFGLKGSYGEGDIKAIFHMQAQSQADAQGDKVAITQRFYFAGLKTPMGMIKYGRMTNAYKLPGFKLDRFYNTAGINVGGSYAAGGGTYGLSGATNGFTDNSIEYVSPKIADMIIVHVGMYIDDSKEVEGAGGKGENGMAYGIKFAQGPAELGVIMATNGDSTARVPGIGAGESGTRVYGSYKGEGWTLGASYEMITNGDADDLTYLYALGTYKFSPATELIVSYGMVGSGPAEGTGVTAGVQHGIADKTTLFALFSSASLAADDVAEDAPSAAVIGMFHNFSIEGN